MRKPSNYAFEPSELAHRRRAASNQKYIMLAARCRSLRAAAQRGR